MYVAASHFDWLAMIWPADEKAIMPDGTGLVSRSNGSVGMFRATSQAVDQEWNSRFRGTRFVGLYSVLF